MSALKKRPKRTVKQVRIPCPEPTFYFKTTRNNYILAHRDNSHYCPDFAIDSPDLSQHTNCSRPGARLGEEHPHGLIMGIILELVR